MVKADSSGTLSAADGSKLSLTCISKGGKPAANINWKISGADIKEGVRTRSELESNGFRFTTISTLHIEVRTCP